MFKTSSISIADEFEEIGDQDLIIEKEKLKKKSKSVKSKDKKDAKKESNLKKKNDSNEIECITFDDSKDNSNDISFDCVLTKSTDKTKLTKSTDKTELIKDKKSKDVIKKVSDLKENQTNFFNFDSDDEKLDADLNNQKELAIKKLDEDVASFESIIDLNMEKKKKKIINDSKDEDKMTDNKATNKVKDKVTDEVTNKVKDNVTNKVVDKVTDNKSSDTKTKKVIEDEIKSTKKVTNQIKQQTQSNNQKNLNELTKTDKSRPKRESSKLTAPVETPEPLNKKRKCTMINDPLRFVKPVCTPPTIGLKLGLSRRASIKSSLHPELFKSKD